MPIFEVALPSRTVVALVALVVDSFCLALALNMHHERSMPVVVPCVHEHLFRDVLGTFGRGNLIADGRAWVILERSLVFLRCFLPVSGIFADARSRPCNQVRSCVIGCSLLGVKDMADGCCHGCWLLSRRSPEAKSKTRSAGFFTDTRGLTGEHVVSIILALCVAGIDMEHCNCYLAFGMSPWKSFF